MSGTLFVVATPIGNLEDITARALRVLREVALIAAEDTRRTANLLNKYAIRTRTTSLHEHNESTKTAALLARLTAGDSIALVSDAGTPVISDPGRHLVRRAIAAGIRVEPVPGPSAVMAALAASGFPSEPFTFFGFPPIRSSDRKKWFGHARAIGGVGVFFEAPHRIRETLEALRTEFGDIDVAVWREMTKVHEELVYGPISDALRRLGEPRGEFTVVVDFGLTTEITTTTAMDAPRIVEEFCRLTEIEGLGRRAALTALSKQFQLRPNELYRLIENTKKSVE